MGVGGPPEWGGSQRGDLNHLFRTILQGLCLPLAYYLIWSFTPDQTQGSPKSACTNFGQDGAQTKAWQGRWSRLTMAWHPLPFWPRGVSLCMCSWGSPWPWGWEVHDLLVFRPSRAQPLFWSCHYPCLIVHRRQVPVICLVPVVIPALEARQVAGCKYYPCAHPPPASQPPWNTVRRSFKKFKVQLTCDPAFPRLGVYSKALESGSQKVLCTSMFTAVNSQDVETKLSMHRWKV